ncbi:MbnP family protein [Spirosoma arcticum]
MKTNTFVSRSLKMFLSAGLLSLAVWACTAELNPSLSSDASGTFRIVFDNVAGNQDLQLNAGTYTNASGESFTPTTFTYFVSNIKLTRTDGREYVVPQDSSYFLIKEDVPTSQTVTLPNVPAGSYKSVSFVIGVDSLRSTMEVGRRTGVLDPGGDHTSANGMYWSWNSGYIFLKLEGTSPSAPTDATGKNTFRYHIGFFGGRDTRTLNNLRIASIPFGNDVARVAPKQRPTVTIQTDVLKIFQGPATVSIAKNPEVMISSYSQTIATNYAQMMDYKGIVTTTVN